MEETSLYKELKEKAENYKGQIVLSYLEVYRLTGEIHDDGEDYYWGYETLDSENPFIWSSCVGGFIPLKGRLTEEEYNSVERIFEMNFDMRKKYREDIKVKN